MTPSTVLTDDRYPGWRVVLPPTFGEDDPDGVRIDSPQGHVYADLSLLDGGTFTVPGNDDTAIAEPWRTVAMEIYLAQY